VSTSQDTSSAIGPLHGDSSVLSDARPALRVDAEGSNIRLHGTLSMLTAREALKPGTTAIEAGATVIDLAGVVAVDSAAVALLLEWVRAAARRGGALTVEHPPAALTELARLYSVQQLIPFAHAPGADAARVEGGPVPAP